MGCGEPCATGIENKTFAALRAAKCAACADSEGDTCLPIEAIHPGKSSIAHGVVRPELRCPKPTPEWTEEPSTCKYCGRGGQIITLKVGMCYWCNNRYNVLPALNARKPPKLPRAYAGAASSSYVVPYPVKPIDAPAVAKPMAATMTAVWVYWAGGAEGDELRYSMRSAIANLPDLANVVLCGDRPAWYKGDYIPSPRFDGSAAQRKFGTPRWCKWIDSVVKLERIIASELVSDHFLWMYDDTFIVQPTTIREIAEPRYQGKLYGRNPDVAVSNSWREARRRTSNALIAAGLPTRNYSTHFPVVYEKQKLAETIRAFDPGNHPRLIESLYLNHHERGRQVGREFQYNKRIGNGWRVNSGAVVVNVGGFKAPVAKVMAKQFAAKCRVE